VTLEADDTRKESRQNLKFPEMWIDVAFACSLARNTRDFALFYTRGIVTVEKLLPLSETDAIPEIGILALLQAYQYLLCFNHPSLAYE